MSCSHEGIASLGKMALLVRIKGIVRKLITVKRVSGVLIAVEMARDKPPKTEPKRAQKTSMAMAPGKPVTKRTPRA